jgi:hypothetical protein
MKPNHISISISNRRLSKALEHPRPPPNRRKSNSFPGPTTLTINQEELMVQKILFGKRFIGMLSTIAFFLLPALSISAAAQDYVVVTNKKMGISSISSSDLEAVFTGKKMFWDSGEKVVFAVYDNLDLQSSFFKQHVHKTPSQFNSYWKKMVFTGKANMPEYLNSPDEVMAFVSNHPGGISFIPAPGGDKVKILNIN